MSFVSTWACFAGIWWVIAYSHGDLEYAERLKGINSSDNNNNNSNSTNTSSSDTINDAFIPCVTEIKSFATAFLFSVETQHTIGKCIFSLF